MSARLAAIFAATDWRTDPNKPLERAAYYDRELKQGLSATDSLQVLLQMSIELLQAGDAPRAVQAIQRMGEIIAAKKIELPAEFDTRYRKTAAIAYLRLGEQQNCMQPHGPLACIFPIHGSGIHTLQQGAAGAVTELTALLQRNPQNWQAQWLLNVAYMQLGRYPAGVPKQWLVRLPACLLLKPPWVSSLTSRRRLA